MDASPGCRWARNLFSLVLCVVFCRSLFIALSFLFWSLYCLSFFYYPYDIFKPWFKCVFMTPSYLPDTIHTNLNHF
jgi:hypothetical protein